MTAYYKLHSTFIFITSRLVLQTKLYWKALNKGYLYIYIEYTKVITNHWDIRLLVLWQPLVQWLIAALTSKALSRLSSRNFTRELNKESLLYCYFIYTFTNGPCYDCAFYPKVHASSMSAPCIHHVVVMWLTCSLTSLSRLF